MVDAAGLNPVALHRGVWVRIPPSVPHPSLRSMRRAEPAEASVVEVPVSFSHHPPHRTEPGIKFRKGLILLPKEVLNKRIFSK